MLTVVLPAGPRRYVHVSSGNLRLALDEKKDVPLCCVRDANDPEKLIWCRKVHILGQSELVTTLDAPLPGSGGRTVCYLQTESSLVLYVDDKPVPPASQ